MLTHLRWGAVRRSMISSLRTWGDSDRLRVRPHTSVLPTASRAGRRVSCASTTAPAIRSASQAANTGSKPDRLEANRL
ncbi:MAG: hypothetical protein R2699_11400 [Acidimicrobiales bacterium]